MPLVTSGSYGTVSISETLNGYVIIEPSGENLNYFQGSSIRLKATFKDASAAVADPTTITVAIETPDGSVSSYVYGTDAEIVRDSTGIYYIDVVVDTPDTWSYSFAGTGTVQAVSQSKLTCIAKEP